MKKVLYLDDSQTSVVLATKILNGTAEIIGANNIPDAIKVSEANEIDLFLVDYQIGSRTSFEFADYLRHTLPQYKDTPIILATSFSSDGLFYKASQRKFNDFIGKPFDKKALPEIINTYLNNPTLKRKFTPKYTTAQCIAWKLGDLYYQYSPDINEAVSAPTFEDAGKKMKNKLHESKKNALVELEIVLHNIPFSES